MDQPGLKFTDPNRKGDIAEQWVALLAVWKGAEVFKNINCTGKTDLVLKINDVLYEIDVKMAQRDYRKKLYWTYKHCIDAESSVIPVLVIPEGDINDWKVRWIRGRHPPELHNFWNKDLSTNVDATRKIKDELSEETV